MGFRNLINSKKIAALLAMLLLGGTQVLLAQAPTQSATAAGDASAIDDTAKATMWAGVEYYVLLFVLVCIGVAIVGRILKVYDLTNQLNGKKPMNWNNIMGVICILFLVIGGAAAYWSFTVQGSMTLPEAASIHGVKIDEMFLTTTVLTMIVFVITQILLFWFLFRYRYSEKRRAYFLPHNNTIEKVWTIIPAIVLTILVVFGFFTWRTVTNTVNVKGDINIDVTGHQFEWLIRYPGKDGKLGNKNYQLVSGTNSLGVNFKDRNSFDDLKADTLVIPVGKSIRINIFAQDVIHSLYMPYFRVQMNAVPGLPTYFKFVPTLTTDQMRAKEENPKFEYLLYCNKICGGGHYNMQKVVRVVTMAEYTDWLSKQKPYLTDGLRKELKLADAGQQTSGVTNRLALNN
ncbi:cytochrome c oxidase subunit II [Mucilaginibacter boryungensis]|uniref:Cytochrome c oxidase subunit 2 n=1 Tax=Mucilaginibacter boryungensis TaxID=768480 RepID=A0ABR9XJV0_9SPHI|nr:cytochrome c oxidase subunit II [Mucilaginibacter boryungensis]MBE9667496.1 cytochrome c oxidase subunit II [Mucilaginibacter boryungensis]